MPSKIAKVGLALILSLTTVYSSNLEPVGAQNQPNLQDGYYYLPPHEVKSWDDLTPQQQVQAQKMGFDRKKFSDWLIQSNPNPKNWAETNSTK